MGKTNMEHNYNWDFFNLDESFFFSRCFHQCLLIIFCVIFYWDTNVVIAGRVSDICTAGKSMQLLLPQLSTIYLQVQSVKTENSLIRKWWGSCYCLARTNGPRQGLPEGSGLWVILGRGVGSRKIAHNSIDIIFYFCHRENFVIHCIFVLCLFIKLLHFHKNKHVIQSQGEENP